MTFWGTVILWFTEGSNKPMWAMEYTRVGPEFEYSGKLARFNRDCYT